MFRFLRKEINHRYIPRIDFVSNGSKPGNSTNIVLYPREQVAKRTNGVVFPREQVVKRTNGVVFPREQVAKRTNDVVFPREQVLKTSLTLFSFQIGGRRLF